MSRKIYWVVPDGSMWSVKHEGVVLSSHYTKAAAVEAGRTVAKRNAPSQLRVMKADGTFDYEYTYELDPYPPSG
jgi:hypothetical protein